MKRALVLSLALWLAAGCGGSSPEDATGSAASSSPAASNPAAEPGPAGTIAGTVTRFGTDEREPPRVHLARRDGDGHARADVPPGDGAGTFEFADLEPGEYLVTLELDLALNGPTFYDHRDVQITATEGARLTFDAPEKTGALRLSVDKGTPPFALFLLRADADVPETPQALGAMWDDDRPHRDVLFLYMNDGRGPFDDVPPIPAGRYQALVMANDWEEGDPPPMPRAWALLIRAGATTGLRLRDRLTSADVD